MKFFLSLVAYWMVKITIKFFMEIKKAAVVAALYAVKCF